MGLRSNYNRCQRTSVGLQKGTCWSFNACHFIFHEKRPKELFSALTTVLSAHLKREHCLFKPAFQTKTKLAAPMFSLLGPWWTANNASLTNPTLKTKQLWSNLRLQSTVNQVFISLSNK